MQAARETREVLAGMNQLTKALAATALLWTLASPAAAEQPSSLPATASQPSSLPSAASQPSSAASQPSSAASQPSSPSPAAPPAAGAPSAADDDALAAVLAPPEGTSAEEGGQRRIWTWVAAGTAGALGLGALVVGLNARAVHDELEQRCAPACAADDVDRVDRRALAADFLLGAAAVSAAVAVLLYFVEADGPADRARPKRARWHLAPLAGTGGAGVAASLKY